MRIFRLHRRQRAPSDYGGSLVYAGRWHTIGTPMLYAASSLSLACLELLVHLTAKIPADYVYSAATLESLPQTADFRGDVRDERATQGFGQYWATQRGQVAIRVPSAVIPSELNVLLNPTHPDFNEVNWDYTESFRFDERLLRER